MSAICPVCTAAAANFSSFDETASHWLHDESLLCSRHRDAMLTAEHGTPLHSFATIVPDEIHTFRTVRDDDDDDSSSSSSSSSRSSTPPRKAFVNYNANHARSSNYSSIIIRIQGGHGIPKFVNNPDVADRADAVVLSARVRRCRFGPTTALVNDELIENNLRDLARSALATKGMPIPGLRWSEEKSGSFAAVVTTEEYKAELAADNATSPQQRYPRLPTLCATFLRCEVCQQQWSANDEAKACACINAPFCIGFRVNKTVGPNKDAKSAKSVRGVLELFASWGGVDVALGELEVYAKSGGGSGANRAPTPQSREAALTPPPPQRRRRGLPRDARSSSPMPFALPTGMLGSPLTSSNSSNSGGGIASRTRTSASGTATVTRAPSISSASGDPRTIRLQRRKRRSRSAAVGGEAASKRAR